jgi:predicted RNA binding protein YcfA (HicA-like mRNA interferase family)
MPKLPAISPHKLAKAIEKAGFELKRVKGSHYYYYNLTRKNCRSAIPL